ncbi:hypothetical protein COU57_04570, partial [Candidatus Pacearchaeota archaeon CG10_big_fil_rev_8_21_14_0_10_32_14]
MKKGLVLIFFLMISLQTVVAMSVDGERYIIETKSDIKNLSIVEEVNSIQVSRSIANSKVSLSSKKFVVKTKEENLKNKEIIRYEPDYKVKSLGEFNSWNYNIMGLNNSIIDESFGKGVKIAILDTGANFNLLNVKSGYDYVNEDKDATDDNGHGTFVTQILKNPGNNLPLISSEIYVVKVLDNNGDGYISDVIEGINWARDNDIDVISMSFGGESDSFFLKEVIQQANNEGILIIAASGNEGSNFILYPAKYDEVISVGSINQNLEKSLFSNYGNELDFVAPGKDILVTDGINQFPVDGTSFSVPHVAIVATAYLSENLSLSNKDVENKLKETAKDLGDVGRDDKFGGGLANYNKNENLNLIEREDKNYKNTSITQIYDGNYIENNQEYSFTLLVFDNKFNAQEFLEEYLPEAKEKIIVGDDEILWLSNNKIVLFRDNDQNMASKIAEIYPLENNTPFPIFSKADFNVLASCSCGFSIPFACSQSQCWAKGSSCYLNGFVVCVDGSILNNGDDSYCRYRDQRFDGCLINEFDCDTSNECSSNLFCVGSTICSGFECGCCQNGQKWNSNLDVCYWPQSINSVSWSVAQANTGDNIKLNVFTSGLNGQPVEFLIWEEDTFLDGVDTIDDPQPSKFGTINNNIATASWIIPNGGDGLGGNTEFYFKAKIGNLQSDKSSILKTKFGHNGWDCDDPKTIGGQCSSNLVCDDDGQWIGDSNEGCCNLIENWNGKDLFCNKAVSGKIFQVTQNGQSFSESPYGNLKLRVFIEDDDLFEDDVINYLDIYPDINGNFDFNPERYISNWNWDTLFIDYKINSIFAIQGNEIIGKWTNQFSNIDKFRSGRESINQIVRIHKDKQAWDRYEFPKISSGSILSTKSLEDKSGSIEDPVYLDWVGKLNITKYGTYEFVFNVTGNVRLEINGQEVINSAVNNIKEGDIKLNSLENNVTFEFYESGNNNPKIYWRYENENLKELDKSNLIKTSTKVLLINELNKLSSLSFSEVNNQPDYMISFMESPEIIRNHKPLILVHGKHGESGYWDEDETQKWFNDRDYDAWEFYYSGEDDIPASGALLGDALDYLKRTNYSSQKFDVVTHSMGGLVSRSYVQGISPYSYKNDVNHLVMIGPPNHGSGASTGITHNWSTNTLPTPYWKIEELRLNPEILTNVLSLHPEYWINLPTIISLFTNGDIILHIIIKESVLNYNDFKDTIKNLKQDDSLSPIYTQMSLGSELIYALDKQNINTNTLVIIGNKEMDISLNVGGVLCSAMTIFHKEADPNEYDCLVSIASSSLLNKNIPISIIPDKNHATELSDIQDYTQLIKDYLEDKPDSTLASQSFVYNNPKTGYKKNFNYQEGSVQIKLLENNVIWNYNSNQDLQIQKLDSPNQGGIFNLQRNKQSKNYFHFNRQDNQVDSYYTLPKGNYK